MNLDKKTIKELHSLCKKKGIKGYSKFTKKSLVVFIGKELRSIKNKKNKKIKMSPLQFKLSPYLSPTGKISKIVHQIWIGTNPLSKYPHKVLYGKSFKNILGNEWKYKLWTNKDVTIENFPITYKYIQECKKIKKKVGLNPWSTMADLMKYELIYHHGGFYFDTNIELLRDITHLTNKRFVVCNEDNNIDKYMSCGFFGGSPYNKYLKKLLSEKNLNNIDFYSADAGVETGPWFFYKGFGKYYSGVTILPSYKIYPISPGPDIRKDKCINKRTKKPIFPCKKYKRSLAIDHFYYGGSWIKR